MNRKVSNHQFVFITISVVVMLFLEGCSVNYWSYIQDNTSLAAPTLSSHYDKQLYVAAVMDDGSINYSSTNKPNGWAAWQPISGAPSSRFNVETSPVLFRGNNTLNVLARGGDDNLYLAIKQLTAAWSSWLLISNDSSVKGRISATVTLSQPAVFKSAIHVVYTGAGMVHYARFVGTNMVDRRSWSGAIDGVIGSNNLDQIMIAIRYPDHVTFESADRSTSWNFQNRSGLSQKVYDLSNLVYFDSAYHIVYARRDLIDDVSLSYQYQLVHTRVVTTGSDNYQKIITKYTPETGRHFKTALMLYRNKLVATFAGPTGYVSSARWDNADPDSPWVGGRTLQKLRSLSRPAVAPFNARANLSGLDYGESNYGNDAFVAINDSSNDGRIAYANLSRALMNRDIGKNFSLWNSRSDMLDPVCRAPSDPFGPEEILSFQADGRPVLTEIGFNLWMFPNWFVNGLYPAFTAHMCDENIWGPTSAQCKRKKLPIYIKASGPIFNCGGAWNTRNDRYIRLWEELGHYMAPALGIGTAVSPTVETAIRTKIPLPMLQQGYALFNERTGSCAMVPIRCRGFTGISNNYDTDGREHSFIYVLYYYLSDGDQIRQFIQQDLAAGDDLLKRKYDWVKNNIFRGIEFRNDVEPL